MLELTVLMLSAIPFLLGLYALKVIGRRRNDDGDPPPPPNTDPPDPIAPFPGAPMSATRRDDRAPRSHARRDRRSSRRSFRPSPAPRR